MRRLKSKKVLLVVLLLAVAAAAGAVWYFVIRDDSTQNTSEVVQEPKVIQTDDVLTYIGTAKDLTEFNDYLGPIDVTVKRNEQAATLPAGSVVKMMVFAPKNEAFSSDEAKQLASVPATVADELRFYYFATFSPSADGSEPVMDLSEGQRIVMLNGRELFVTKGSRGGLKIMDAKGREAAINQKYVEDPTGSRLYYIDNILLLQ